jgi:hypothetical protein
MSDPHQSHLDAQPPDIRARLEAIQAEVERRIPRAERPGRWPSGDEQEQADGDPLLIGRTRFVFSMPV